MRRIVISAISSYQRHISPRKGFKCAYGCLHGNGTCSSIIKTIIQSAPAKEIIPQIIYQLRLCSQAYNLLKLEKDKDEKEDKPHACCAAAECGACSYLSFS
ncbi:membrane protein insertion efficiency factor YidD [Neptuniibacter sp.]|uniref:membrane protein insertion efficiency factor YidD n=1 Tax=Neptuniibacter sp. TaxID=1962643 RepID=UPI003B58D23B